MKRYRKLFAVLAGMFLISSVNLTGVSAEESALTGDMNSDHKIGVADIVMMYKYLHNQQKITKEQFIAGDVNQDGRINIFDFIHLKQNLIQTNQKQELQIDNIRCLRKGEWEYDWKAYSESTGAELYTSAEELAERFYDNTIQVLRYDDAYFETHDLLAVFVTDPYPRYQHFITGIETGTDWKIHFIRTSLGWNAYPVPDVEQDSVILIQTNKSPESAESITVTEQNTVSAKYFRTYGYQDWNTEPVTVVITSREELENYCGDDLLKDCDECGYDAEFFETHQLVFVIVSEGSGSYGHAVTEYTQEGDKISIQMKRLPSQSSYTADMAEWHIAFETDKTVTPETDIAVTVSDLEIYRNLLY